MSIQINGELLLLARQYRGRSQAEVADRAGLDQGHYSRIERGLLLSAPTEDTVIAISEALDFPPEFFAQQDELSGLPLSVHGASWRKRASVPSGTIKQLRAELNLRIIHLKRLIDAVEIEGELPLPVIDPVEGGGPEKIASRLRQAWMLPNGPIRNLTALCERAGILIIHCDFADKIDGVTMRIRELPPLIFLNRKMPADRMRHSLAHELGHLIMHSIPSETMEEEADTFAGELLAPYREVQKDIIGHRVSLELLVRLKKYWKVSVASLLYKISKNGLITDNQSSYLWRNLSARGWRSGEPEATQFPHETPKLFPYIITLHQETLKYGIEDFVRLLNVSQNDISILYGVPNKLSSGASHLRLIK